MPIPCKNNRIKLQRGCCCSAIHVTGNVTFSFTATGCSFSGEVTFDDDIPSTVGCCTGVTKDISVTPSPGNCQVNALQVTFYLEYDRDLDVWNLGVVAIASSFSGIISAAANSFATAAGGCSTSSDNPTFYGPLGTVTGTLDFTPPIYGTPDATGNLNLVFS
jgi:hypothetical protein